MKRMIDNKEFNEVKNDVSELEVKVDNIKTIPTITIALSQYVDQTHIQLTDEQYNILDDNNIVNINLPTGNSVIFNRLNDNALIFQYSSAIATDIDTTEPYYFSVEIVKSTKIATLSSITIPKAKQLYQHNIYIYGSQNRSGTTRYLNIGVTIINDDDTPFTFTSLLSYLSTNGFNGTGKGYTDINGLYAVAGGGLYNALYIYYNSNSFYVYGNYAGNNKSSHDFISDNIETFTDTIIPL